MKGRYIVLEGMQGSGKTSQITRLAAWLRSEGKAVFTTREPGGADLVARTLRLITQNPTYKLNTRTEVLLYNASRSQSLEIIRDLVGRGVWVLCDRSFLTTLAIQYYARGDVKNYDDIVRICEFAVGDMMPDMMLVLDIDPETAQKRADARYRGERFDQLKLEFLKRMQNGYLKEAKLRKLPVIDARKNEKAVFTALQTEIKRLF